MQSCMYDYYIRPLPQGQAGWPAGRLAGPDGTAGWLAGRLAIWESWSTPFGIPINPIGDSPLTPLGLLVNPNRNL